MDGVKGPITEHEMVERLRVRYPADSYAVFPQVPDGTGMAKRRTADAIAMSLWPSRGLELHGFEIKRTRGDWLKELSRPIKAEPIFRYMDRWWVVTANSKVVEKGELPPKWGLIVVYGDGLRRSVQAEALDPEPPDRAFIAGLLRGASQFYATENWQRRRSDEQYKMGKEDGRKFADDEGRQAKRKLDKLEKAVTRFREVSGVHITDGYQHPSIDDYARAVKLLAETGGLRDIVEAARTAKGSANRIVKAAKKIEEACDRQAKEEDLGD